MRKRNTGIDLLRLVSMFFIVGTHVVNLGGILLHTQGLNNTVSWLVLTVGISCLNCYALISGYVGYREEEKPYPYTRILSVWLPVFFYSVVIYAIGCCAKMEEYDSELLLTALTPAIHNSYWYFTAYVPVFFAAPWLNRLFRNLTDREMTKLALTVFVLFSVLATVSGLFDDIFNLDNGMSFLWLFALYIIGAWLRKCNVGSGVSVWWLWGGALLCILASVAVLRLTGLGGFLLYYFFPPYVVLAVLLVIIFSRFRTSGFPEKAIGLLAPATFGVYLIHCHPVIGVGLIYGAFVQLADDAPPTLWLQVLGWICVIFFGSLIIERIRIFLFRVCRIDSLVGSVEKKLSRIGAPKA